MLPVLLVAGVAIGVLLTVGHSTALRETTPAHGFDVSWPQCSGTSAGTMPPVDPSYLILGLTHGSGHTVNPCLADQLAWAKSHHARVGAYLVASYPVAADLRATRSAPGNTCGRAVRCLLRRDGEAQATAALATMRSVGLHAPIVWLDVELGSASTPWSGNTSRNAAVLQGVAQGLRTAKVPYGVYTTSVQWADIAGGFRLDVPNWIPSGDRYPAHALAKCPTTATGGVTWLVQYTKGLDSDLTCPVIGTFAGHRGPLWKYRTLTIGAGAQGASVRALQRAVGSPPTGTFDPPTVTAVTAFESAHHLPTTGTVGPGVWSALGANRRYGGHGAELAKIAAVP